MKIMERIALGRTVYLVLAVVGLLVLGAVYTIFGTEADFAPSLETVSPGEAGAPSGALPSIEEPAYAYESDLLTFAGSCTAGSMLGSAVWGTFNGTLEEEGAAYFLENLADLLKNDDFTLAGLDVTLSDRELPPAEKEEREWYIAPSGAADVFPSGGIDALSMEFPRTRDYGGEGYADTAAALQSAGIEWGDSGKAIRGKPSIGDVAVTGAERFDAALAQYRQLVPHPRQRPGALPHAVALLPVAERGAGVLYPGGRAERPGQAPGEPPEPGEGVRGSPA